jgi:hypothetical protein
VALGTEFDKGGCLAKIKLFVTLLLTLITVNAQTIDELFRAENGNEWAVEVAEWGYVLSAARPRPNGTGEVSEEQAIQISNQFLEKNAKYFGMESLNYTQSAQIKDREGKRSWVVVYEGQKFEGLPVMDTHTTVLLTLDGQVYAVGNLRYHFDTDVEESAISQGEAVEKSKEVLGTEEDPVIVKKQIKPIFEDKTKPQVVWNISYGCPLNKNVIIDGRGNVIEIRDFGFACKKETNGFAFLIPLMLIVAFAVFFIVRKKGKKSKGIAFGLLLVVLSLSLVSLTILQKEIYRKNIQKIYIENRIYDMNNMFESVTLDLDKAIEITAKRAIAIADSQVITTGNALINADQNIKELILFGSINGVEQALMENATLNNWISKMNILGREKGYEIKITINRFEIKPYDSFNLLAEGDAWINITNEEIKTSINRRYNISKTISIENFEDPIYALNTNSRSTKVIKKTKFDGNYTVLLANCDGNGSWKKGKSFVSNDINEINSAQNKSQKILVTNDISSVNPNIANQFLGVVSMTDSNSLSVPKVVNCSSLSNITNEKEILLDGESGKIWDIENLLEHYHQGYYSPSLLGPSFLDRLEGKLFQQEKYKTERITGIESFVDKDYFGSIEIATEDDTNIDYLYFNNTRFTSKSVKGMPESFLIDDQPAKVGSHQQYYGVSSLLK